MINWAKVRTYVVPDLSTFHVCIRFVNSRRRWLMTASVAHTFRRDENSKEERQLFAYGDEEPDGWKRVYQEVEGGGRQHVRH